MAAKNPLLKVCLLGNGGVGKSCLMNRYVSNHFDDSSFHTIGVEFLSKEVHINSHNYTLQIWDTAGQERFKTLRTPFYRGSDMCLLVFSVDDKRSFDNLLMWRSEFLHYADIKDPDTFPFVILANKVDIPSEKWEVSLDDLKAWCDENNGMPYIKTSAKSSVNVAEAFTLAVEAWTKLDKSQQLLYTAESASLTAAQSDFEALGALDRQIKSFNVGANPYTWFTMEALEDTWRNLQKIIKERDLDLSKELERQEENDKLRKEFAKHANAFHLWLTETRTSMMEGSGSLEQQLEATKAKAGEVRARKADLKKIEDLGAVLEEHLILDNRYTEHSTVGLAQQWDQLDQLGMRMQHNLEQQIQARNHSGVSEDALKEFSMMFKHFDKDKSGRLNLQEFKSCLRALGYDLPMVEEGQPDPEFEAILDVVDPHRDGHVSLQEYMAFMISKETENVQSSEEIELAFRAITAADRPYVTKDELYANLTKDMADYCVARMKPYVDPKTERTIPGALDYIDFTHTLFHN